MDIGEEKKEITFEPVEAPPVEAPAESPVPEPAREEEPVGV